MSRPPTDEELAYLRLYKPTTYGLQIPRELARGMTDEGWIKWTPPVFGTTLYAITPAGEAVRKERDDG